MSRRAAAWVGLAALLAGCDAALADDEDGEAGSAWIAVTVAHFDAGGETRDVEIPAPTAAVAVRATAAPGVCFQLSRLVDADGRAVLDGRSAGPYCRDCALRTSVAAGAGVFVIPAGTGGTAPETGLSLRFARVDCTTLTPLRAPDDRPTVEVAVWPIAAVPERATIDLRFHIAASSILSGDEQRQEQLLAALTRELAPAGIVPRLVDALELDAMPDTLGFHAGDPSALAAVLTVAPPRDETTIDVVFGGCLEYDDPIFGPPGAVDGFTPRIPGGAGPADGVFMPGLDCFARASGPVDVPVGAQARVLAHELGHYLGLYHVVEQDGRADLLDDTDAANIMHFNPRLVTSAGFSRSQGRVMRMHPAARPR